MSTVTSQYKSLIHGVSQQQPEFRQDGQVSEQLNMLSDPVEGLRRRPGTKHLYTKMLGSANDTIVRFVEIGGKKLHIYIYPYQDTIEVYDEAFIFLYQFKLPSIGVPPTYTNYLSSNIQSKSDIVTAVVGDELFICNKKLTPIGLEGTNSAWKDWGFVWIRAGTFSTKYSITVTVSDLLSYTATYFTPDGTGTTHADETSPSYIRAQLANALNTISGGAINVMWNTASDGVFWFRDINGGYTDRVSVTANLATTHMVVGTKYLSSASDLPPIVNMCLQESFTPTIGTGSAKYPTYYTYNYNKKAWLESGVNGIAWSTIMFAPIAIRNRGGTIKVIAENWDGRLAGDKESSPYPKWVDYGEYKQITGMSSYQGRLVILCGSYVSMSSSTNPRRFMRSTITSVVASDPVEVAASGNSSATYTQAVQYMKDLLLFSSTSQAVIPSNQQAITPSTATVVITGELPMQTESSPVQVGNSLMLGVDRDGYMGVCELLPSESIPSQYSTYDVTQHIPKYYSGTIKSAAVSMTHGIALFSNGSNEILVHQFVFDGGKKVQQAWHKWSLPIAVNVQSLYFVGDTLFIVAGFNAAGYGIHVLTMNIQAKPNTQPYLDFYRYVNTNANADPLAKPAVLSMENYEFKASYGTPQVFNVELGTYNASTGSIELNKLDANTSVSIGYPYLSKFVPTEPVMKDRNGLSVIGEDKLTVLRYTATLSNSAKFNVRVVNDYGYDQSWVYPVATVGEPSFVIAGTETTKRVQCQIPIRMQSHLHTVTFSTSGTQEMNIKALGYVVSVNQRIRRF